MTTSFLRLVARCAPLLVAGITACGGNSTRANNSVGGAGTTAAVCPPGDETCPCYGNDTCNSNLTCASHLCVKLNTGGASSVGATAATGGAPGAGGAGFTVGTGSGGANFVVGGAANGGGATLTGGLRVATPDILAIQNAACVSWSLQPEVPPSLLEFVVDTSGSMLDIPQGSSQSKWQVTQAALANAIANYLPASTAVGLLFYPGESTVPNHNDTAVPPVVLPISSCVNTAAMVPVAPLGAAGSAQRAALAAALASAYVAGGTPTDDAYQYAYRYGLLPALSRYPGFDPSIVLITDGQPTIAAGCAGTGETARPVDWHPIVNDIATAYSGTPITRTFIVGSPGSESQSATGADGRPWLSQAARSGGTAITPDCTDNGPNYCHFDLTQSLDLATDLAIALKDIASAAVPCSFRLAPPVTNQPIDPGKLNVIYEEDVISGTPTQSWLIGQTSDSTCGSGALDGWYFSAATGTVVLCPHTCGVIHGDGNAALHVVGGCPTL